MSYYALKHIHMTFAVLSGALFLLRGLWMLAESRRMEQRWVKVAPHVIDTLLLASAVGLALWSSQYPGQSPWLTAKLVALVAYIGLGTVALKRGRTRKVRTIAFIGALACFGYILAVALTKNPLVAA